MSLANTATNQSPKTGLVKWIPMVILSLALMIIIIDTTVLNVSLRNIVHDLNTSLQGLQWVITAYALTLAALTITGGRLGDLFGRKRMFMLGAVIFAVGSFVTSISHSVGMMIVGESLIEGVGAALMMPATASLLVSNYRDRDRAIAFGIWGGIAAASAAIGPIVGGFLTTHYSWRWAFRINVVVVLILLAGSTLIAEARDRSAKAQLDWLGVVLSSTGLLAFVYGIIESSTYGWWQAKQAFALFGQTLPSGLSPTPLALGLGIGLLSFFVWWQYRTERQGRVPLVSLHLFQNVQFTSGAVVMGLLSLGMVGLIFAIPVFLQSVRELDALHTGLALVPMSLTMLVVAPTSAIVSKKIAPKHLIQLGLLAAMSASIVLRLEISASATAGDFIPGLVLFGLGMGLVMAQVSNMTLSAVPIEQAGEASGVNNTMRQIGSSFGSAIIGAVLLTTLAGSLSKGIVDSSVIPAQTKAPLAAAVSARAANVELGGTSQTNVSNLPAPVAAELVAITHQASAEAARRAVLYTSFFIALGLAASNLLPNTKQLDRTQSATGH